MYNRPFLATGENSEELFVSMAIKNIDFALISLRYIIGEQEFDGDIYLDRHTYYFYHIQSLLAACGNIYNIFYNAARTYNQRTVTRIRYLREKYGVNKSEFKLIFQKEVRNTNMHFDERYEQFNGHIGDYNIIDEYTPQYMIREIKETPHLRTYDRTNQVYITYNNKLDVIYYDLFLLRKELISMKEKLEKI